MKILSLVVFNKAGIPIISAPSQSFFSPKNKAEGVIKDKIARLVQEVQKEQKELNLAPIRLSLNEGLFYAKCTQEKSVIVAMDQEIKPMEINDICDAILKAKDQAQLDKIVAKPESSIEQKFKQIDKEILESKAVLISSMNKLLERGERIEILTAKTKKLEIKALTLRKKAKATKNSFWWNNLFAGCVPCCCDDSPVYSFMP